MISRCFTTLLVYGFFVLPKIILAQSDLDVMYLSQSGPFSVCEASDLYSIQIQNNSNAFLFQPFITAQLPVGIHILPGSCELSYPAGSPFQPVTDPTQQGQDAIWDVSAISPYIAMNGLGPTNSDGRIWLRFQVEMDCDYADDETMSIQVEGDNSAGITISSLKVESTPIKEILTDFTIQDFDVTYFGGVAGYRVIVENLGDSLYSGLKLRFYSDDDNSGTYTPTDTLRYTDLINFGIGPGQPIPLASGIPVDLLYMCDLFVVIDADETCACGDAIFQVDNITREMAPTSHCSGSLATVGVPEIAGHTYEWTPADYLSCDDCAYPIFQYMSETDTAIMLTYHYVETAGDCVLESDLEVTILPAPDFMDFDTIICRGEEVELTVDGGQTYQWNGPNITDPSAPIQTVSPQNTSSYSLTVSSGGNCQSFGIITVVVDDVPFADINETEFMYCEGQGDIPLQPFYVNNYSYEWFPANAVSDAFATNPILIAEESGYLIMEVTLPNGCSSLDTAVLNIMPRPDLELSQTQIYNCVVQTVDVSVSGGQDYTWSPTTDLNCLNSDCSLVEFSTPNAITTYSVISGNSMGCSDTAYVTTYPQSNQIATTDAISLCNSELPLVIFGENITESGQYCKTFTTSEGCDSTHCMDVEIYERAYKEDVIRFCMGDTTQPYTQSGIFCDTFQLASGCDSIFCKVVEAVDPPELDSIYYGSVGLGETQALPMLPLGYLSYDWGDNAYLSCSDCPNPTFSAQDIRGSYTYNIEVASAPNCVSIAEYIVNIETGCSFENLRLPNAFTPDGDGTNDSFGPRKIQGGVEDVRNFRIYNKWGNLIFESRNGGDWDGMDSGSLAPSGVYVWVMHLICPNNLAGNLQRGSVTLIR